MTLLLDSALKSTIILLAAWLAVLALHRGSADVRHRIWLAAILAVAAMPLLMSIVPQALPPQVRIVTASQIASGPARASRIVHAFPWLFTMWAAGAMLVLAKFAAGMGRIALITRNAVSRDGVHYTEQVSTPLTWGFFKPVIVLPASAATWTEEQREIVMRHERAHIERHDWLWQTLSRIVTAVFWFHPFMWLATAELRRESELAVDDRVLSNGADPADYAAHLVSVAKQLVGTVPAESVAMVRTPALENRVRAILDKTRPRLRASWMARTAIVLITGGVIFPLMMLQAQEVHKIGEKGLTPPRVISKAEPHYTEEARDARIEGTVALRCVIDEAGIAENIEVVRSLDPGLDTNAVTAVTQWRFAPAMKDGKAVRVLATIEVNFHLL
ncbi:MAG TPA: M56 family metallopeptidase [Bryobacteraceae bacterium]|nr:M56 family metallopeptidase [Bryobacteraceae bacterium]